MEKKKKKRSRKSQFLLLLVILSISIGFAYLSSTLRIIGNAIIGANVWDVSFENIRITEGSTYSTAPIISADGLSVDYVVDLEVPGDFLEFKVDVVNNGTMNAMINSIANIGLTSEQEDYLEYSVIYENGAPVEQKDSLKINTVETYVVRITYRDDISGNELPTVNQAVPLRFTVEYAQADKTAKEKKSSGLQVISGDKTNLQLGDEVRIGDTEEFYVVSSDQNTTVLLSKYNLYVGYVYDSENATYKAIRQFNNDYGLQKNIIEANRGTVSFSWNNYWYSNENLLSKYGDSYPTSVYDSNYNANPKYSDLVGYSANVDTENYSIAYYVDNYVNLLSRYANGLSGRLLTKEEVESIFGCQAYTRNCSNDTNKAFIKTSSFWLETAYDSTDLWILRNGYFSVEMYDNISYYGVRPVIVVPTQAFSNI